MTAVLDTIQAVEDDIFSILRAVELALANVSPHDPLRSDLEEIRTAAQLAVVRAERLVVRTVQVSQLGAA